VSDIAGGVLGWIRGERGRSHVFERRYRRAAAGGDVAVGVLAHFVRPRMAGDGWRCAPEGRAGDLVPEALGSSHAAVPEIEHLAIRPEALPVAELLLGRD
jgi:hypothetical protein